MHVSAASSLLSTRIDMAVKVLARVGLLSLTISAIAAAILLSSSFVAVPAAFKASAAAVNFCGAAVASVLALATFACNQITLTETGRKWCAQFYLFRREYLQAEAEFREGLKIHPNSLPLQTSLGKLLISQKKYEEAEPELLKALALDPINLDLKFMLGIVAVELQKYDLAEEQLTHVTASSPNDYAAHFNLAAALYNQDKISQAEVYYKRARDLKPSDPGANHMLGACLSKQNKHREAVGYLEKAVNLKPEDPSLKVTLASTFILLKNYPLAETYLKEADSQAPSFKTAHLLGILLYEQKRYREAEEFLRSAIEHNETHADTLCPINLDLKFMLGTAAVELKKYDLAEAQLTYVAAHRPNDYAAHFNLALAFYNQDKIAEAAEHSKRAHDLNPLDPDANYMLGNCLFRHNKHAEAIPYLKEAIRLKPEDPNLKVLLVRVQIELGTILYGHKKYHEAEKLFRSAVEHNKTDADAHYSLGLAIRKQEGRSSEATSYFLKALELDPSDPTARAELSRILTKTNTSKRAVHGATAQTKFSPNTVKIVEDNR